MRAASSTLPVSWHRYLSLPLIRNFPSLQFFTQSVASAQCIPPRYHLHPYQIMPSKLQVSRLSRPSIPDLIVCLEDEIFQQKLQVKEKRPESFAEEQARRARETIDKYVSLGEQPVQIMQG
jgi:hypothetical protein